MNRRNFLKRAGYVGGGLAAADLDRLAAAAPSAKAGPGASGTARAEAEKVRVGIITEPGGQHLSSFTKALGVLEGVEMVAAADPSGDFLPKGRELLGARASSYRTFSDYRQMLEEIKPQLALLALEPHHTPPVMEAVLEAGGHILADKPACVRLEDFERVVRLAQSKRLQVMLGLTNRVSRPARRARELVESGLLGKLYGPSVHLVADQTRLTKPAYWKTWMASQERAGGGKLIYHGFHYLDLVHYIAGDQISEVTGFTRNVGGQPIEVEDSAVLAFRLGDGAVGTLNTGYYLNRGYSTLVAVWGSQGWLRFDLAAGPPMTWASTHPDAPKGVQSYHYQVEPNTYHLMIEEAVNAARGLAAPPITSEESHSVLKVVFAAYQAAAEGTTQKVS